MDNYRRALLYARSLFLEWDQQGTIDRCRLRSDDQYLYIAFLGEPYRIDRQSGAVERIAGAGEEAGFSQALSIYDYICRREPLPALSGRFCAVNSLPHVGQSNPSDTRLHSAHAAYFQQHLPALRRALQQIGCAPYPMGDAACLFPVFDGFHAVFQFWEGDEDFPPSVRFLWDENAQGFLKYETLYYVMSCFLDRLRRLIDALEA